MMEQRKVALVTGAATGIGSAIAVKFASLGYDVILHYFSSQDQAEAIAEKIQTAYGVKTLLVQADLAKEEEIHKMVEKVFAHFSHVDILVNNAAVEINSAFSEKDMHSMEQVFRVNVFGPFLLSKLVGEAMYQRQYGKIVFISSNNAIDQNDPVTLEYDASKAALHSLVKNMAQQFSPYVNVNAVAPGWISTEKVEKMNAQLDGKLADEESKRIMLARFGQPAEVANVVAFLASDEASYIQGEIIRVDGGVKNA